MVKGINKRWVIFYYGNVCFLIVYFFKVGMKGIIIGLKVI